MGGDGPQTRDEYREIVRREREKRIAHLSTLLEEINNGVKRINEMSSDDVRTLVTNVNMFREKTEWVYRYTYELERLEDD